MIRWFRHLFQCWGSPNKDGQAYCEYCHTFIGEA